QGDGVAARLDGIWKLRTAVPQNPTERRKVRGSVRVQKTLDGDFDGGRLDLHVFVPRDLVPGVTETSDTLGESLGCRVDGFYFLLKQLVGISRGDVTVSIVDPSLSSITDVEKAFEVVRSIENGTKVLAVLLTKELVVVGKDDIHGV